jgi:hypothetical protein
MKEYGREPFDDSNFKDAAVTEKQV